MDGLAQSHDLERRLGGLRRASLAELERLYAGPAAPAAPSGCYAGTFLARTAGWERCGLALRSAVALGFAALPFSVDFDHRVWGLAGGTVRAGHFELRAGQSRWRRTDTLALHYDTSRLPAFVRRLLYDEVKPLGEDLLLGLGGVTHTDLFFFALCATRERRGGPEEAA